MRISDLLNSGSVPPCAHEEKQKGADVQPSNLQPHARLDTLGGQDGRVTKRKKSAASTRSAIKQSDRFALKSSSQNGALVPSNKISGFGAAAQETRADPNPGTVGTSTSATSVSTGTTERTTKRGTDKNHTGDPTTWLAAKIATAEVSPDGPTFSMLDFRRKQPPTRPEELIGTFLQRSSDTKAAKYAGQLRHFAKWAAEEPGRETLDDVINSELTPKNQPTINAWRKDPHNPYAREGYAAFNALRATYGKTVDPRNKPLPRYDTLMNLNDA
ncbi:hypothetical protein IHE33_06580 [Mycetohabitans endofungorum]|uniref:hypothetical protein n=1 Tax=Mycetohabitans endofungorum TaxID=417203 RepID=UPI0030D255A2